MTGLGEGAGVVAVLGAAVTAGVVDGLAGALVRVGDAAGDGAMTGPDEATTGWLAGAGVVTGDEELRLAGGRGPIKSDG